MRFTKTKFTSALVAIALTISSQPAYAADAYKIDQQMTPGMTTLDLVDSFSSTGEGASFMLRTQPVQAKICPTSTYAKGLALRLAITQKAQLCGLRC
jgi:hypothetical protein